jgi:serine/threonine-protein kinase
MGKREKREEYSVVVERAAFPDDVIPTRAAFPEDVLPTIVRPVHARRLPLAGLPAEVDKAFQPWLANVTTPAEKTRVVAPTPAKPAKVVKQVARTIERPKATPLPPAAPAVAKPAQLSGRPRPISHSDEEPTWAERQPGSPTLIDGKYRVEAVLGSGGMGVVVAASHIHLGTTVAIKTLRPDAAINPEMAMRFQREARAASRLRSDHVCKAIDVGQMPTGEPFIVMEMLHGRDLASLVSADGPMPVADAAFYLLQACEAIAEAHALGMIHRDLKPANLMLTQRSDGAPHIKVLDFGIATSATGDIDGNLTRADVAMGSPGYMSPEQLRSAKSVDARSDIWSIGVTLYELVSGYPPFSGDSVSSIAIAVATEEPEPLQGVPPAFAAVIARCLKKKAADRYPSIAELAAALAPFVHDGAARAARIASTSVTSAVPPTLMADGLMAARVAVTAAVSAAGSGRREAPALVALTALPSAQIFTPKLGPESTQQIRRARRMRMLPIIAIAAIAAIGLAVLGYVKLSSPADTAPAPAITATPIN